MAKQPRINSKIEFEWNASYSILIKNLGFGKPLNLEAAKIFYKWYRPYIPYKSGKLTNMVHFASTNDHGTITHYAYGMKNGVSGYRYSKYQYALDAGNAEGVDERVHRTRTVHRLATSHWDKWAWSVHKKEITDEIKEARKRFRKPTRSKSK